MNSEGSLLVLLGGVAPFGDPRIEACLQLPEAYRSLLRPSSPLNAKASVRSPYALDRSQQNSCVLGVVEVRTPATHTCALY